MPNPIVAIYLTIQRGALDINPLILGIKVDITDRTCLVGERAGDGDGGKEGRGDEVYVLPGIRKQAHHAEKREGGHGARVIVAGKPGVRGVEARWDICSQDQRVHLCAIAGIGKQGI